MRIQVINPNTTSSMTADIAVAANRVSDALEIVCVQPPEGPAAIETEDDVRAVTPSIVDLVSAGAAEGCAAHVIACFGDPAIDACRRVARGPVLGIAEGSMIAASVLGSDFGVLVPMTDGIANTWALASRYGFSQRLRSVRSTGTGVLGLDGSEQSNARVLETATRLVDDGAEVLVLGCGGMADLVDWLASQVDVPVVEGVRATVGLAMGLVGAGLETSKRGRYGRLA